MFLFLFVVQKKLVMGVEWVAGRYTGWPRHGTNTLTRHDTELIDITDLETPWQAAFGT